MTKIKQKKALRAMSEISDEELAFRLACYLNSRADRPFDNNEEAWVERRRKFADFCADKSLAKINY